MGVSKKALGLSAATATAAGLVLSFRGSRSEGASNIPGALGGDQDDWQLSDYLHAASRHTKDTAHSLAHAARSARFAWEQRQAEVAAGAPGGGKTPRPPSAVLVADFLAALNDNPGKQHPGSGVKLLNNQLSCWLLDRAAAPTANLLERRATLRYLGAVLRSEEAGEALLQQPGAAPLLLSLAAHSSQLQQLLLVAVACSAAPVAVPAADIAAVLKLLTAEQQRRRIRQLVGTEEQQPQLLLGLQLLLAWARASQLNAMQLAEAGVGRLLSELAAISATGTGLDGLQLVIAQLMGTLAHEVPKPQQLLMQGWLYHLLCFAADAAANSQWQLADASLSSFATCLLRGCELPPQLMQRSTLPLLHKLAAHPDAPVRPAIAVVVQALAGGPAVQLPQAEREIWTETLLGWLVQQPIASVAPSAADAGSRAEGEFSKADVAAVTGSGRQRQADEDALHGEAGAEEPSAPVQRRLTAALQALSSPAGSEGIHVAHAWLAELIISLSHQVQVPALEAQAAAPATPNSGGGSSWWWPWRAAGSSRNGSSAIPSSSEAQQTALISVAGASEPTQAEVEGAEAAAAASGQYLPPDAAPGADNTASDAAASGGSSWWRAGWWPWGGSGTVALEGQGTQQAVKATGKPSDSELALYINAAPIGPVYARSVAATLLEASGRVGSFQEPPSDAEELMGPEAVAMYPQVAAAIDWDVADSAVCAALKVLCALASGGSRRRAWLLDSGALPLLHRLTMERERDVAELPSAAEEYVYGGIPLCIQRQAVRLLAMLASDVAGAAEVQEAGWVPWLQELAVSTDLKLSSCASRALLHMESAAATQRTGLGLAQLAELKPLRAVPAPLLPTEEEGAAAAAAAAAADAAETDIASYGGSRGEPSRSSRGAEQALRGAGTEAAETAAEMLGEARLVLAAVRRRLDRQLDVVRPAVPPQDRLVLQDGVHLFDPLAAHHEVLAREGVKASTSDAPLLDIVFVHGIRGGAFATWRREGVLERGQAHENLDRSVCWPAAWLAKEVPEARLLSLEYAAPASGWEGESLPFQHIVAQMMDKLAAAGVGQRPVIFVCHSMGGLVVKDLLVTAKQQQDERLRRLYSSAAGAVFYSVPHAGSKLADWGWYLRYVGGAPAKHVQRLKTGHHQGELNAAVRAMCKSGQLPVLSLGEGLPTRLGYIPTQVVPHESAYPGYGDFHVLYNHDHISVCKPTDPSDPAYTHLMAFLHSRVRALREARATAEARRLDHMEASVL